MARLFSKIALLHHVGGGNLGDDATLDVVVHNIKRRWPHAVMVALSMNPGDTQKRHGIPSYPIRTKTWSFGYDPARPEEASLKQTVKALVSKHRLLLRLIRALNTVVIRLPRIVFSEVAFLLASRRLIKSFDVLVVSGGGQLTEWGGPWGFPYTLFKWALLAKSVRVKCVFLNLGAGPLCHPLSKLFVTRALRAAEYVSFRDEASRALVHDLGFTGKSHVSPDSVYSLAFSSPTVAALRSSQQPVVGVAPMPYCDPRVYPGEKNQAAYDEVIRKLAMFSSWLVAHSYSLALFGTDIGVDPLAIEDLEVTLQKRHRIAAGQYVVKDGVTSLQQLLATISGMDYVVTCRYHGVVFAHLLNKPVLAVAHHPKVTHLMSDLGMSTYCIDIQSFDATLLIDRFAALVSNADEIKNEMSARLATYQQRLERQFDDVFSHCNAP
jgi:polysaccharide pyruvyl transferase WcaK-like protein